MFIEQRFILPLMIVKYEHALPRNSTVHSFAEVTFVILRGLFKGGSESVMIFNCFFFRDQIFKRQGLKSNDGLNPATFLSLFKAISIGNVASVFGLSLLDCPFVFL